MTSTTAAEPAVNGKPPRAKFADKKCACGIVFEPTNGKQMFHSTDCPEYIAHRKRMDEAARRRARGNGNGNGKATRTRAKAQPRATKRAKSQVPPLPGTGFVDRLSKDCDREIERLVAALEPAEAQVQKIREDLERVELARCAVTGEKPRKRYLSA